MHRALPNSPEKAPNEVTNGHTRRHAAGTQLELPATMTLKPRRTVLIVEDALTVRNMLEDFFTMYGYDVLMASDPDTAFKRLKDSHAMLDAMILDIALDDNRSGLEVLELMRLDDRFADLTVVVLTGLANLDDRDVDIINRNRAHLLYKQEGYERVFNKLDQIIKPLRKNAAENLAPAPPAAQAQTASATQSVIRR
jgi:CheY-like chemotaxis protein